MKTKLIVKILLVLVLLTSSLYSMPPVHFGAPHRNPKLSTKAHDDQQCRQMCLMFGCSYGGNCVFDTPSNMWVCLCYNPGYEYCTAWYCYM